MTKQIVSIKEKGKVSVLNSANKNIAEQFQLLVNFIQFLVDHTDNEKEKKAQGFRLANIKRGLSIIKKFPNKINSGADLDQYYGIGKGIKARIDEIIKTGELSELKEASETLTKEEKNIIMNEITLVNDLSEVIGIGRSIAKQLIQKYNIKSIKDLIARNKKGEIPLNDKILMGLKYLNKYKKGIPRKEMDEINAYLIKIIHKLDKNLIVTICGSYRRGKLVSNDIDVLLSNKENNINYLSIVINKLMEEHFIVDSLTSENTHTKYMGFCKYQNNPVRRIDIRFVAFESYYPALLYFTGPDELNKKMRNIAKAKGFKLNEYGLFKINNDKKIHVESEEDIFNKLDLVYIPLTKR